MRDFSDGVSIGRGWRHEDEDRKRRKVLQDREDELWRQQQVQQFAVRASSLIDELSFDPATGRMDPSRLEHPDAIAQINALFAESPEAARAFGAAASEGLDDPNDPREFVRFQPSPDGRGGIAAVFSRKGSTGPETAGGVYGPEHGDTPVVVRSGEEFYEAAQNALPRVLGMVGAYHPEGAQRRRDLQAAQMANARRAEVFEAMRLEARRTGDEQVAAGLEAQIAALEQQDAAIGQELAVLGPEQPAPEQPAPRGLTPEAAQAEVPLPTPPAAPTGPSPGQYASDLVVRVEALREKARGLPPEHAFRQALAQAEAELEQFYQSGEVPAPAERPTSRGPGVIDQYVAESFGRYTDEARRHAELGPDVSVAQHAGLGARRLGLLAAGAYDATVRRPWQAAGAHGPTVGEVVRDFGRGLAGASDRPAEAPAQAEAPAPSPPAEPAQAAPERPSPEAARRTALEQRRRDVNQMLGQLKRERRRAGQTATLTDGEKAVAELVRHGDIDLKEARELLSGPKVKATMDLGDRVMVLGEHGENLGVYSAGAKPLTAADQAKIAANRTKASQDYAKFIQGWTGKVGDNLANSKKHTFSREHAMAEVNQLIANGMIDPVEDPAGAEAVVYDLAQQDRALNKRPWWKFWSGRKEPLSWTVLHRASTVTPVGSSPADVVEALTPTQRAADAAAAAGVDPLTLFEQGVRYVDHLIQRVGLSPEEALVAVREAMEQDPVQFLQGPGR